MYMKTHLLAALREELDHWERTLAGLSEAEIDRASTVNDLSIKDEIAHLMAWQQRSIARMEAGLKNVEPVMPEWLPGVSPESEEDTDLINAHIYKTFHDLSWEEVHRRWQSGFSHFLAVAEQIPEPALLDSSRFAWMGGYSLADVILGTYDHHQEHMDKLVERTPQSKSS